jgi:hypothetical protein
MEAGTIGGAFFFSKKKYFLYKLLNINKII